MTNFERRGAPRTGRDVWSLPGLPGYLDSIQAAGAVAAPLLAGASFTLAALVLQASSPFARWPDLALLCFVASGLAQVFAVQCVVWTRRYMMTPDELRQWFPDDFHRHDDQPTAWLKNVQWDSAEQAVPWARRTVSWLNAGIALLLAGVAASVVPPGHISALRWAVIVVGCAGVAVEASWVTSTLVGDDLRGELLSSLAVAATSAAALAAAVLAGLSTAPGFPVAVWWAIGLAILAAVPRLSALCGLRLRGARLRYRRPSTDVRAITGGLCALLPPVTFVMAAAAVRRVLARQREDRARDLHPGVEDLLPHDVTISAHHHAVSRCVADFAADDDLKELLDESGPVLGTGQPALQVLAERVRKAPECVVTVVDRHDRETRLGYFIVYPLREEAVLRITRGEIKAGHELTPGDLAMSAQTSAASYVCVIWAPGAPWTRRCVIATLVEWLAAIRADGIARPVFARPATDEGRSLMKQYGLTAIGGKDDIWALDKQPPPQLPARSFAKNSASRSARSTLPPARALQSASDQPRRSSSANNDG